MAMSLALIGLKVPGIVIENPAASPRPIRGFSPIWRAAMKTPALALLALLAATASVRATLDAEADKPYQFQVVLQVADNRCLTPLFQQELERALGDQLRKAFGKLANVHVERKHELLAAIAARGLELVLDGWDKLDGNQTHFVLLDFTGGQYRLQSRPYDGTTGQAGTVQRVTTGDRVLVPILAARLVERTLRQSARSPPSKRSGNQIDVQLTLAGGAVFGVPKAGWVEKGDVFAVSRVVVHGTEQRATRIAWALLQVDALGDGVCHCRYWRRFAEHTNSRMRRGTRLPCPEAGHDHGTGAAARARRRDAATARRDACADPAARQQGEGRADDESRRAAVSGANHSTILPWCIGPREGAITDRGDRGTHCRVPRAGQGGLRDAGGTRVPPGCLVAAPV